MSLYKRNKIWWVSFTAANGERVRRSSGTADKQQAQEYQDRLKSELWRIHRLGEKPRHTWQEATVRWIKERSYKADAVHDREKLRWLHSFLGHLYLDEISRDVVERITDAKSAEVKNATVNRYLALIRAILRAARDDWEWVDRIPRFRLLPEPKKRVRWLRREEAAKLLAELPSHLADLAALTLATGLRQSNASLLTWEQVDLERGMAWIHADESKSGKALAVPLNEDALSVLRKRRGEHPTFCITYQGHPVARTSTKAWYKALARAGIVDFRWHDLRHTWASWHAQAGTSPAELQELGGWSTPQMVNRYAHLGGEHLKTAASRIDGTNLAQSADRKKTLKLVSS